MTEDGTYETTVDLNAPANTQNVVTSQRIPMYLCPSETRDRAKPPTTPTGITRYPLSYAANEGTWLALLQSADVRILQPRAADGEPAVAGPLDLYGGIGAVLRF